MRIFFKTLFLGIFLAFVSCVNGIESIQEPSVPRGEPMTFSATRDDFNTRTAISSMDILWKIGDQISIFDGSQNAKFSTNSDNSKNATFSGIANDVPYYYALYPYSADATLSGNAISCVIPKVQYPTAGQFDPNAALMVGGTGSRESLPMMNCCAYIKFELKNDDVTSVVIQATGDGEVLTGAHSVVVDEQGGVTVSAAGTGTYDSVTCKPQNASSSLASGTYFACVSPSSVSGIRIIFNFADGSRASKVKKTKACTLERNCITDFGRIDDNITRIYDEDGTDDDTVAPSSYGFDYSALLSKSHPRLFLDEEGWFDLKTRIKDEPSSNVFLKKINDILIKNADTYLQEAVPSYTGADRLTEARLGLKHLFTCSYAFRITGDRKYLEKAKADLAAFCSFADWNPNQYLCIGETAMGVSIAYDWLYGYLTAAERELAREKLYAYAIGTYKDYINPKSGATGFGFTSNWNEVCWSGLVVSSIALFGKSVTAGGVNYGNSKLMELLELAVNPSPYGTNAYQLPLIYGSDGSFDEGYNYWDYGTGYEVLLIYALEQVFGKNAAGVANLRASGGFMKTPLFLMFNEGPLIDSSRFGTFGFADGGSAVATIEWPMYWFAKSSGDDTMLANEILKYVKGKYTVGNCDERLFAALPCIIRDMDLDSKMASPSYPSKTLWHGGDLINFVIGRDGWTGNDTDAYFAFKGGYPARSHGHMDIGEFVFDYNGERWSHDITLGWTYSKATGKIQEYDPSKEYNNESQDSGRWWFFFTNNIGHSVISVMNGALTNSRGHVSDQLVGSKTKKADIVSITETATEMGGKIDLTPVYSDRFASYARTVKMVKEGGKFKKLVITDEITSNSSLAPEIQWRMLTPASVQTISGSHQILSQNGKSMRLSTTVNGNVSVPAYQQWNASSDVIDSWYYNVDRDYTATLGYHVAGFTATIQKNSSVTITTTISPEL